MWMASRRARSVAGSGLWRPFSAMAMAINRSRGVARRIATRDTLVAAAAAAAAAAARVAPAPRMTPWRTAM